MDALGLSRPVIGALLAAILAGCGGGTTASVPPTSVAQKVVHAGSWMDPNAKKDTLLYVSLVGAEAVYVYTYPARKLVGQIGGFQSPEGLCSDRAGHVFVSDYEAQTVYEFAHGGTQPIATFRPLTTPEYSPVSCSVDPASNNLAVESDDVNYVFIFEREGQTATIYKNPYAYGYFGSYDGSGNFFARGTEGHIAELAKGSSIFRDIPLSRSLGDLVGFAWDGKYLSIATNDSAYTVFDYRVRVRGLKAIVVSSKKVLGARELFQFTIYNHEFIGPDLHASQVTFWKYPGFGKPVGAIEGLTEPVGTAISVAQ